ncbi:MAG TPA: histidine kinase [Streptosporangiaceae bacterium]
MPWRILVTIFVAACLVLAWRRSASAAEGPKTPRGRLRELAGAAALFALALEGFALFGPNHWLAFLAVLAVGGLVVAAPRLARVMVPVTLIGLGLYGFGLVRQVARYDPVRVMYGVLPIDTRTLLFGSPWWIHLLLPQTYAFLAAGLWLLWRTWDRHSTLALAIRGHEPGWGLLLLPVTTLTVIMLGLTSWFGASWWSLPWTAAVVVTALILVVQIPAAAADLAAAGLLALGGYGIALAAFWPAFRLLPSAYTVSVRYGAVWVDSRTLALLAGVQGLGFLAMGVWLVPRTIGAHARALLQAEPDAELAGRVERLAQTRAHAVDTAAAELRRVERDLHDGAQARLVALGMSLRAAERLVETSPQAAVALIVEARETSSKALTELRDLVRGIYPPVLADRGLGDAIRALALDTPISTEVTIHLPGRLDAPVESAVYFAVAEALANAVKHADARHVQIRARHSRGLLRVEVTDDGTGGADPAAGTGLLGVERRLGTFDGILAVSSPPGGPTMIVMEVPCALSSLRTSSC